MSNPLIHYGIVAVVALIAWSVSRNIDGPIVHILVTILAAWLAWKYMAGMGV
jgi:hypothetical protein